MNNPLVTVVISSYNRPAMLKSALQSVLAQTYAELEILVQDDSTNEDCYKVVQNFSDGRIVYSRNDPPLGTSANLCAGYKRAQGKYLCTLNDDDRYDPLYLRTMVTAMERNEDCSVAFSDHFIIDEYGSVDQAATEASSRSFGRLKLSEGVVPNALLAGIVLQSIPGMFALFKREIIDFDDFPAEVSSGYDYWLIYLALRDGHHAYYMPQRLTYYRAHKGSQSAGFSDPAERLRFLDYLRYIHERFLSDSRLLSVHAPLRPRLAQTYSSTGFALVKTGNNRKALQQFFSAWKIKPSRSSLLGMLLCCIPLSLSSMVLKSRMSRHT